MKNFKMKLTAFILVSGILPASVFAGITRERCKDDQLYTVAEGIGRNQWAVKCGYMTQRKADALNPDGDYLVFTSGRQPTDPNAPCIEGLVPLSFCQIGCFGLNEKVYFDQGYLSFLELSDDSTKIMTLDISDSIPGNLKTVSQKIAYKIKGLEKGILIELKTVSGKMLKVTKHHPMVLASGEVVRASTLASGQYLLNESGESDQILSLKTIPYNDEVWNIAPESKEKADNFIIAEGLVSGSHRFQSLWADENYRLKLRE